MVGYAAAKRARKAQDMHRTLRSAAHEQRFVALYRQHFAYVYQAARRLGGRTRDLEDLVHDVFVVVHRKADTLDWSRSLKPYLYGVVFRIVSDYRKRAAYLREAPVDPQASQVAAASDPAGEAERRQAQALVMRGLDALPMDQRAVFVMHELDDLTIPEIAAALGVGQNTLYSRLRLARGRFAKAIRRLQGPARSR